LRVVAANEQDPHVLSSVPTLTIGDNVCSVYLSREFSGYIAANLDSTLYTSAGFISM